MLSKVAQVVQGNECGGEAGRRQRSGRSWGVKCERDLLPAIETYLHFTAMSNVCSKSHKHID